MKNLTERQFAALYDKFRANATTERIPGKQPLYSQTIQRPEFTAVCIGCVGGYFSANIYQTHRKHLPL